MRVLAAAAAFAIACDALSFDVTTTEEAVSCPNDLCSLRMSASWELLQLVRSDGIVLARTYDKIASWEELKKETITMDLAACQKEQGKWCFTKGSSFTYTLKSSVVSTAGVEVEKHQAARLFQQAAFGASEADIEAFRTKIASSGVRASRLQWIDDQVALPASLTRPYARKRINPRFTDKMAGEFFQPAEVGSRWHRYAFSMRDEGKIMQISDIAGTTADDYKGLVKLSKNVLTMDSPDLGAKGTMVSLTEVSGAAWHAIKSVASEFQVCEVAEGTEDEGSTVVLAAPGECTIKGKKDRSKGQTGGKATAPNVAIAFADPASVRTMCLATKKMDWSKMRLDWLSRGSMPPHTLIMQAFSSNGLLNSQADQYRFPAALQAAASLDEIYFLQVEDTNTYFRYDARLKLLTNTEESPTTALAAEVTPGNMCPATKVDVMNPKQACSNNPTVVVKSACSGRTQASCGQRGEVANDPNFGNRYPFSPEEEQKNKKEVPRELDYYQRIDRAKTQAFRNFALSAADQLRQRVTWALYQKVPISEDGLGTDRLMEAFLHYMDIFAVHAFGNYRDILREVSSSPLMGMYLSFVDNKAYASDARLPDQNYAREVMQLFSIGMTKLNMDGTHVLDDQGQSVPTYDNKDIVTFARVWTGFRRLSDGRGNSDAVFKSTEFDPMPITGANRDAFPKTDLMGGYIGDGYPLCKDLPPQHFLKKGARYVYSGTASVEGAEYDERTARENLQYEYLGPKGYEMIVASTGARCMAGTHCGDMSETSAAKIEIDLEGDMARDNSRIDEEEIYMRGETPSGTVNVFKVYKVAQLYNPKSKGRPAKVEIYPYAENKMVPLFYADTIVHINRNFPPGTKLTFHNTPTGTSAPEGLEQYTAAVGSPLHQKLCGPVQSGTCSFPPVVTLEGSLQCSDGVCGKLQDLTTVKVKADSSATEWHYYTYVPPPCTKLTVFDGRLITRRDKDTASKFTQQCADPAVPVAGAMCCLQDPDTLKWSVPVQFYKPPFCNVLGERMTMDEAQMRCSDLGTTAQLCENAIAEDESLDYSNTCGKSQYTWTSDTCSMKVQVKPEGSIALVVDDDDTGRYTAGTLNDFYPVWDALSGPGAGSAEPNFPEPNKAQTPDTSVCTKHVQDGSTSLVCSVSVEDTAVFADSDALEQIKSQGKEQVEAMLSIGAVDPLLNSDYTVLGSTTSDVTAWVKNAPWRWTNAMDVIIGVKQPQPRGGGYKYYMNRRSTVWINKDPSGNSWAYSFRNPPTFMRLVGEGTSQNTGSAQTGLAKVRDMYAAAAETTALLDHLFYHQSTAPFLARHMIQRMTTSNPSPGYIERVATAFAEGTYGVGKDARGSGSYGCLQAMITAVLLDSEATSSVLEADPSFGHVHEPYLKLMRVLRSLQFKTLAGQELFMDGLQGNIGQDAFMVPSVFGFYLPDYIPKGPLADKHLVSPESELLVSPLLFGLLNGLTALVQNGLSNCDQGFGYSEIGLSRKQRQGCLSDGSLTWTSGETTQTWEADKTASAGRIVDKLDLLLTSGRLAVRSKQLITDAVTAVVDPPRTLKQATTLALELLLSTAEFHSTGFSLPAPHVQPPPPITHNYDAFSMSDYKVVVVVIKKGGADSWNYLIPGKSQYCRGTLSYDEYATRRGDAAVPMEELEPASGSTMEIQLPGHGTGAPPASAPQPCSRWYLHPNFTSIRDAYNAGEAAFFANIGNLAVPVNKDNWRNEKKTSLPPNLFSHDQQRKQAQTVDPLARVNVDGILGKMADAVETKKKTDIFTFGEYWKAAESDSSVAMVLNDKTGTKTLRGVYATAGADPNAPVNHLIEESPGTRSHFAETYCKSLRHAVETTSDLAGKLDAAKAGWEADRTAAGVAPFVADKVSAQFSILSQFINLRKTGARESHRDVFVVTAKGYDTHSTHTPPPSLKGIDDGIGAFREEMKRQGVWDNTVVVTISEFGRAIPPNAAGTDHGWGGHYAAVGGKVKQTILGGYPASLTVGDDMDSGRGAFIPYRGWETMWAPIADWFGVPSDKHDDVLPNLRNFPEFAQATEFKSALFDS